MTRPQAEDEPSAFCGKPVTHDCCVHRASCSLECAVNQLNCEEERGAQSCVVNDISACSVHDGSEAHSRAEQAQTNYCNRTESISQHSGDEAASSVGELLREV